MKNPSNESARSGAAEPSPRASLTARSWLLWSAMFAVVLALTGTIPLLYLPLLEQADMAGVLHEQVGETYTFLVALTGMVVVFCLYVGIKQRELNGLRKQLHHEEGERAIVASRLAELSALFQVSVTLNLQMPLDTILEIIVRRVISTLKAQQASIMLYEPHDGTLETRASYGLESEFARNARAKLGEGIAGWVAQRNQAILLAEQAPNEKLGQHYKRNRNITSALSLPIRVGERCIGVLNVNRINFPTPFQEHHRDLLLMFADHVGAAVDRARALEEMGSLARQLEADNQRLSETNRLKDVFLSTATHELKTPLTSVIAYAELLGENAGKLTKGQQGEFLSRLRGEAQRLLSLIDDILDLSRIESGKMPLNRRRVSIEALVKDAVQTSKSLADRHGVRIEVGDCESLPEMPLDEVKMRQVVVNMLVNAVKFSPQGAPVSVRVRRSEDDAVIEVADHGPGVTPEETAYIFELFGQGVSADGEARDGLGIGLHLVKRISELHGGHVGVNSRAGEGSTFWVRLPLALAELPEADEVDLAA